MNFIKKTTVLSVWISGALLISCGSQLPIQEMTDAKLAVEKAEQLHADKYEAESLNQAKEKLKLAHENAAEEKGKEAENNAVYAKNRAEDAMIGALPKLTEDSKTEADKALGAADEAYAQELAKEQYTAAQQSLQEGDRLRDMGMEQKGKADDAPNQKERTAYKAASIASFEQSYYKYQDSEKSANSARDVALGQRQQIIDSLADIDENLNRAEEYSVEDNPEIGQAKGELSDIRQLIADGKIKEGYTQIEPLREKSNRLLQSSMKSYAEWKKTVATESVATSKEKLNSISEDSLANDKDLQVSYQTANENLKAADEALGSATDLLSEEKYEGSIERSEEAIRLSKIVLEQSDDILAKLENRKGEQLAEARAETAPQEEMSPTTQEEQKAEYNAQQEEEIATEVQDDSLAAGWKKYIVRKKVPVDCLWRIAGYKEHYGNPRLWRRIYKANKSTIKNPNLIYPKQVLLIPPKKGSTEYPKVAPTQEEVAKPVADEPSEEMPVEEAPVDEQPSDSNGNTESVPAGSDSTIPGN